MNADSPALEPRIEVGDRVRWIPGGEQAQPVATVIEVLPDGSFRWRLDRPQTIHPLFGWYQEGHCFRPEYYEVVESP